MDTGEEPKIVEVEWVKGLWEGAKPLQCIHRHIGYLVSDTGEYMSWFQGFVLTRQAESAG